MSILPSVFNDFRKLRPPSRSDQKWLGSRPGCFVFLFGFTFWPKQAKDKQTCNEHLVEHCIKRRTTHQKPNQKSHQTLISAKCFDGLGDYGDDDDDDNNDNNDTTSTTTPTKQRQTQKYLQRQRTRQRRQRHPKPTGTPQHQETIATTTNTITTTTQLRTQPSTNEWTMAERDKAEVHKHHCTRTENLCHSSY